MNLSKATYFQISSHLILLLFQLFFWNFIIDDAFITFRYAKNLYSHQQMVFNLGEIPVEGYSNFLWVLLMSVSFPLNIDPIVFSKLAGMIFCHLSVFILYKLAFLLNKSEKFSNLVIVFYVLTPNIALWSVGGLETSLFSFLLLISVYFFIIDISKRKNNPIKISPLFFVLLSLTRHEGLIVFGLTCAFFTYLLFKNKEISKIQKLYQLLYFAGFFVIFYAPYFFWRVFYYNNILPHTFSAKQGIFNLDLFLGRFIFYIPLILILTPVFLLIGGNFLKNSKFLFKNEKKLYLVLLILILSIILLLITSWMPGFRFAVPIIPLIYLLLPKSLNFLTILGRNYRKNVDLWKEIKIFTILAICVFNILQVISFYPFVNTYGTGLRDCNITLGKWINENTSNNASLAVWDVGVIPFYSNIRTIDIYPYSLQDLHVYNNPADADYILEQNITLLILNDDYFNYIKVDSRFLSNYHLIFYAQVYYADFLYNFDYIYQVYLFNDYYIPESAINALINSSHRFYI